MHIHLLTTHGLQFGSLNDSDSLFSYNEYSKNAAGIVAESIYLTVLRISGAKSLFVQLKRIVFLFAFYYEIVDDSLPEI
jgi:hypothetical protein